PRPPHPALLPAALLLALALAGPSRAAAQAPPDAGVADAGPAPEPAPDGGEPPAGEDALDEAEQEVEDDAEDEDLIPVPEIGRRIEETFRALQELAPVMKRSQAFRRIQRGLPAFRRHVELMREEPALERLDTLSPAALDELEQEWGRVRQRLLGWQQTLEGRSEELSEARADAVEHRDEWTFTRDEHLMDDAIPPSQRARIDLLLERIEQVLARLDRRLFDVLGLQGELSDQGIRIAASVARISTAKERARSRRLRRDHRPAWQGWGPLDRTPEPPDLGEVTKEHVASIETFLLTERHRLVWHLIGFLAVGFLFGYLQLRTRSDPRTGGRPSPHRAIRARPVAAAVLLSLIAAPVFYPYVPVVVEGAARMALVPSLLVLIPHLLRAAARPISGLVLLAGLTVPMSLGYVTGLPDRLLLFAFQLAGLVLTGWLFMPGWSERIARETPLRQRFYALIRLSIVPQLVSVYFHLSGFVERSELWTYGTLRSVELIVGLFFATKMAQALMLEFLRRPEARMSYTVRERRRWVGVVLSRLLWLGATFSLGYLVLSSFDALEPTAAWLRRMTREELTFGSIELSVGDVLAFVITILGTFAVMRLVHALLENELLPRTSLEKGVSSAISLSVSYLLVAVGIVLAFGMAGVGPERLALLGGALGVGIGFGLQNVVSNFVSGLILVAERPIEVGDTIQLGDLVGEVRRIGIRSSTVRALDGAEVIVPNSDLLTSQLINWTFSDLQVRVDLEVGTAYRHAPRDVMPILEQVVRTQPGVLAEPAPSVLCTGFGASSIDYKLIAWTTGYLAAIRARSRLAVRVYDALADANIEIPFPQRDLNLRTVDPEAAAALTEEVEVPERG
ncbi:MAG: mechanosensitive ion channel domain-containing protein, partial [Sandaracinaceae bacterium]